MTFDLIIYKFYESLGPFRFLIDGPIETRLFGINCGDELPGGGNWDGFCPDLWHKGWSVPINIALNITKIIILLYFLKRLRILKKQVTKSKSRIIWGVILLFLSGWWLINLVGTFIDDTVFLLSIHKYTVATIESLPYLWVFGSIVAILLTHYKLRFKHILFSAAVFLSITLVVVVNRRGFEKWLLKDYGKLGVTYVAFQTGIILSKPKPGLDQG